jgi:hypothetical protein
MKDNYLLVEILKQTDFSQHLKKDVYMYKHKPTKNFQYIVTSLTLEVLQEEWVQRTPQD